MSKKFKGMDYENLNESTKERLGSVLDKALKSGFSIIDYNKMNDKDFATNLGIKLGKKTKYGYSNVYSYRKLFRQVKGSSERKQGSIKINTDKFKKQGWRGKGLEKIRRDLVKTVGATFNDVYEQIQKHYKYGTKAEGYEHTRQLLKTPIGSVQDLNDYDQDVIEGYDTSP